MSTTPRLNLHTVPLMLNVKQGNSEYELLKSCGMTRQGNEPSRGGVEDTKLKAKDTKKIRGQGQGPRTQVHLYSKTKKGLQNFFQAK